MSHTIAVADIGGTNARFALATIEGREVVSLGKPEIVSTSEYASFEDAWRSFADAHPGAEPDAIGIAFAGPVEDGRAKLTNNAWSVDRDSLRTAGIERAVIVNDFSAVAHAVAALGDAQLDPLCGPDRADPPRVTTIVGPGTGLGVAMIVHSADDSRVIATEGGHGDFAPTSDVEDRIVAALRQRFGRVSAERVASGPGLANLSEALNGSTERDHKSLWQRALSGDDPSARALFDCWAAILGSFTGNLALAHGADRVVIAGGLGFRLRKILPGSPFAGSFLAKPPFEQRMSEIAVKMLAHPQPGLLGAALAFARAAHCN